MNRSVITGMAILVLVACILVSQRNMFKAHPIIVPANEDVSVCTQAKTAVPEEPEATVAESSIGEPQDIVVTQTTTALNVTFRDSEPILMPTETTKTIVTTTRSEAPASKPATTTKTVTTTETTMTTSQNAGVL